MTGEPEGNTSAQARDSVHVYPEVREDVDWILACHDRIQRYVLVNTGNGRFEVIAVVSVNNAALWCVTTNGLPDSHRSFERACYLHLHDRRNMEAEGSIVTWVITYQTTRRFIQKFRNLHGSETFCYIEGGECLD